MNVTRLQPQRRFIELEVNGIRIYSDDNIFLKVKT